MSKLQKCNLYNTYFKIGLVSLITFLFYLFYWFEVSIVLSALYIPEHPYLYKFHYAWFTFLLITVVSNLICTMFVSSAFDGKVTENMEGWRFCVPCNRMSPPRSWHCKSCGNCILKRDHHCVVLNCCIGYKNERYFLTFLLYMVIGAIHVAYINGKFLMTRVFVNQWILLRVIFPVAFVLKGVDKAHLYTLSYFLVLACLTACGLALIVQGRLALRGTVAYECKQGTRDYDLGCFRNLRQVCGDLWFLTLLSPFLNAPLPGDGVSWNHIRLESSKCREYRKNVSASYTKPVVHKS